MRLNMSDILYNGVFISKSIQNISLKPDYMLEKVKNLSKLRKLLNNMENVD